MWGMLSRQTNIDQIVGELKDKTIRDKVEDM